MQPCEHCGEIHQGKSTFCPQTGKLIPSRLLPEGTLLEGKYRIGRTIGIGGMGAVFEAHHTLLDKRVAIKVMLPDCDPDMAEQMSARMVREARAASATGHRNIAQVTDMGWVRAGSLFVVMEFLDGRTFKELLAQHQRLPVQLAARLMGQVLAGLDIVHRKGIVHRDLKPDNLMLVEDDEGQDLVKILDFGISKMVKGESKLNLTSTGLVMGTPQYMSPEQAKGATQIDHRTDIYSTGAILYRLVTSTLPHQHDTLNALIAAVLTAPIDPPSKRQPGLPRGLDAVLLKALARDPDGRFQDARAFREALRPFEEEQQPAAVAPPSPSPALDAVGLSSLVALDETGPPPPAAEEQPARQAPEAAELVTLDQRGEDERLFMPPDTEEKSLELDMGATAQPPQKADPAPVTHAPDHPDETGVGMRSTGPYGQAKRSQARPGIWIALGLATVGALLWFFVLRGDENTARGPKLDAGDLVEISFDVSPSDAEVNVDGVSLTTTPLVLPRSRREYIVTVRARGHVGQTVSFTPETDRSLTIHLKPRQRRRLNEDTVRPKRKRRRRKPRSTSFSGVD